MLKFSSIKKTKITELEKKFGRVRAIDNVSFDVPAKKITALIGPNGAGKTTIFNIISGLLTPESGKIIYDGQDITNFSIEKRANLGISRLFQSARLFENLTVKQNLELALRTNDDRIDGAFFYKDDKNEENKQIDDILEKVILKNLSHKYAGELSWGQKKLVELARAILLPHKLLLLDEPASGVIPIVRQENIAKTLNFLKERGETILLIDHDVPFTFSVADYIILMSAGKIVCQGEPAEVAKSKKALDVYFGK